MGVDAHGILKAPDEAMREGLKHKFISHKKEMMNQRHTSNDPSFCDADLVREILFEGTTFDYVGVTERMSTTILPLIAKMIFGNHKLAMDAEQEKKIEDLFEVWNEKQEEKTATVDNLSERMVPLRKDDLSESTKEMIARESAKDQQLYEEARDRFAHWPRYLSHEDIAADDDECDEDEDCHGDDDDEHEEEAEKKVNETEDGASSSFSPNDSDEEL